MSTSNPTLRTIERAYPFWLRGLTRSLAAVKYGSLELVLDSGFAHCFEGEQAGAQARLVLRKPLRFMWHLRKGGDLGFAESYMAGDWDSPDLTALLRFFIDNEESISSYSQGSVLSRGVSALRHRLRRNNLSGSRKNIAYHYDLGNDFYRRWLDQSMTYSSAVFDAHAPDLEAAQENKYRLLLESLKAEPGAHILEVGCGWGGFAEYAASQGYRVTGITLSQEQLTYARQRMKHAGLADKVELRLQDYRHVTEQFDHIVSIEMFEAVGQEYWGTYFAMLAARLKPGGKAALQVITIDEADFERYARESGGFIQTYIFPGGMLPSVERIASHAAQQGLVTERCDHFGVDYADTLKHWRLAFDAQGIWLGENGYDERFRRMWHYYLSFCEAGFRHGRINVVQTLLTAPAS